MQVGDLVWSLLHRPHSNEVIMKRLAIILKVEPIYINPYIIKLVACGREGRTSKKYLEPLDRD